MKTWLVSGHSEGMWHGRMGAGARSLACRPRNRHFRALRPMRCTDRALTEHHALHLSQMHCNIDLAVGLMFSKTIYSLYKVTYVYVT